MPASRKPNYMKMREETDLSLEVIILLILGVFMFLFGILLFRIHTGELPYNPDSTYGLFLVIVSFQIITMGKTPFGDLRRSLLLVIVGICAAILGMVACYIPGTLSWLVRVLVGVLLLAGGISLLLQLFFSEEKARIWMKVPRVLQHLTIACGLIYAITIISGLITLFPMIKNDPQTGIVLIAYGISFFYLSWCIHKVSRVYPEETGGLKKESGSRFKFLQEASIPLSLAVLIMLGVLLSLLGFLLFPVNMGLLPFSPDGQLGLLLVVMAIQMMALGDTPMGQFKRSWLMIIIGIVFASLGIFSCIVPGILTGLVQMLIGVLNILGGGILLLKRFIPIVQGMRNPPAEPVHVPPVMRKLMITQTVLNVVSIAFGLSMLTPGLIPAMIVPVILIINGILLLLLGYILQQITRIGEIGGQTTENPSE
ncbi:hypothetical protein [Methanobacterium subterraneum]|nr:hypothetical protein [Methanobacterium subterraneum]